MSNYNQNLRNRAVAYVDEYNRNYTKGGQARLAEVSGINKSVVSDLCADDWVQRFEQRGLKDSTWTRLAALFGDKLHLETENYQAIIAACAATQKNKLRQAIDGYTGAGKSYALKHYRDNNKGVYLIQADNDMSRSDFFNYLCDLVGAEGAKSLSAKKKNIIEAIKKKSFPCLLIFDECEYFKKSSIWYSIKSLCDSLEGVCGVIICGIIEKNLRKLAKNETSGFSQILRRFELRWLKMESLTSEQIKEYCREYGINDRRAIDWVVEKVDNYDTLTTVLFESTRVARKRAVAVTEEILIALYPFGVTVRTDVVVARRNGKKDNTPIIAPKL